MNKKSIKNQLVTKNELESKMKEQFNNIVEVFRKNITEIYTECYCELEPRIKKLEGGKN